MPTTPTLTVRAADGSLSRCRTLAEAGAPGPWLVVVPHDDDMVLGMGLTVLAAVAEGIRIDLAIVSDGRMGYADPAERPRIQATRRAETEASCRMLGIPPEHLHWLGLPDSDLKSWRGRRFDAKGEPTGIAHGITKLIRKLAPGTVFGPTRADLHPDHMAVAEDLAISCFHAGGEIWLELGQPVAVPERWDFAVYCPFPGEPTLELRTDAAAMTTKLDAIRAYVSQRQIGSVVEAQRTAGPVEYLQRSNWTPYSPSLYASKFRTAAADPGAGAAFASDCARVLPLLQQWPARAWAPLAEACAASLASPLLIVGEGSSRLFPAALACALARRADLRIDHLGGREASALDLARRQVLLVSNSGKTREVVDLAERMTTHPRRLALVGQRGGRLMDVVPVSKALLDAPETTVAATVSVFAQALAIGHAVAEAGGLEIPLAALRTAVERAFAAPLPPKGAQLGRVRRVWWSGPESGCASELALKTMETAGCLGAHLPGSMVLHGIEEVLDPGDLVVLLDPDARDLAAIHQRIGATGAQILRVGPGGDIDLPGAAELGEWAAFPQLVAGWRLLAATAQALGRDPDKPKRARKVGNEWTAGTVA